MTWSKGWIANEPSSSVTSAQAQIIAALGDVTTTAAELNASVDANTATAAEINNICDGSASYVKTTDATTYAVLAANTGKVHLVPDLTAHCTMSLPAEVDGLKYTFVYAGAAEDAQNLIITSGANANFFLGGVEHQDLDNNTSATVYSNGSTNAKLTITTPGAGTMVNFLCNGTTWWVWGTVCSATAPAFAVFA